MDAKIIAAIRDMETTELLETLDMATGCSPSPDATHGELMRAVLTLYDCGIVKDEHVLGAYAGAL